MNLQQPYYGTQYNSRGKYEGNEARGSATILIVDTLAYITHLKGHIQQFPVLDVAEWVLRASLSAGAPARTREAIRVAYPKATVDQKLILIDS